MPELSVMDTPRPCCVGRAHWPDGLPIYTAISASALFLKLTYTSIDRSDRTFTESRVAARSSLRGSCGFAGSLGNSFNIAVGLGPELEVTSGELTDCSKLVAKL